MNVTIIINQMYIHQSKANVISFRLMYIDLMYDDSNNHCVDKLYLIFFIQKLGWHHSKKRKNPILHDVKVNHNTG